MRAQEEGANTTNGSTLASRIIDSDRAKDASLTKTPLQYLLLRGFKRSKLLRAQLPEVRRLALIEAILDQQDDDETMLKIILENVQSSPYLSKEKFQDLVQKVLQSPSIPLERDTANEMAEMVIDENWDGFLALASSEEVKESFASFCLRMNNSSGRVSLRGGQRSSTRSQNSPSNTRSNHTNLRLRDYRNMVVKILSSSRRIATMNATRRRNLEREIHSARSIDEIKKIAFDHLDTSEIFVHSSDRQKIRDVVSKGRYDILLLSEYFDCEEMPRLEESGNAYCDNADLDVVVHQKKEDDDKNGIDDEDECLLYQKTINPHGQTLLSCNRGKQHHSPAITISAPNAFAPGWRIVPKVLTVTHWELNNTVSSSGGDYRQVVEGVELANLQP